MYLCWGVFEEMVVVGGEQGVVVEQQWCFCWVVVGDMVEGMVGYVEDFEDQVEYFDLFVVFQCQVVGWDFFVGWVENLCVGQFFQGCDVVDVVVMVVGYQDIV